MYNEENNGDYKMPIIPGFKFRVIFMFIYSLNYEEENVIPILIRNSFSASVSFSCVLFLT